MAYGNYIRVIKGNQELLVSPVDKEKYLQTGFSVIEEDGTVTEQGVKSNHTLKSELDAANKRIEELEAELKKKSAKKTAE